MMFFFFHILKKQNLFYFYVQWKTELDEVIEVASLDSELWVSMIAETVKTFPATGSLNTEISDYEETRPIFIDLVNDLKKYVNKHSDLGMLPLECQYLNKMALTSVVSLTIVYYSFVLRYQFQDKSVNLLLTILGWTTTNSCETFYIKKKTKKRCLKSRTITKVFRCSI